MDSTQSTTTDTTSKQQRWDRDEVSRLLQQIRSNQNDGSSLNQSAVNNAVPRTTAQNWGRNYARLEQRSGLPLTVVQSFRITPRARVPS
jgi:hypothetical protein